MAMSPSPLGGPCLWNPPSSEAPLAQWEVISSRAWDWPWAPQSRETLVSRVLKEGIEQGELLCAEELPGVKPQLSTSELAKLGQAACKEQEVEGCVFISAPWWFLYEASECRLTGGLQG